MSGRLTEGFRDIIELRWDEFRAMELDESVSNFDAVIASIVRACMKGNLRAIQTALDRLDGKIAMEVEVEYPKFYTIYPQATVVADDPNIIDVPEFDQENDLFVVSGIDVDSDYDEEQLPTGSLRSVLEKILDSPKNVVTEIIDTAKSVDEGDMQYGNPLVKSVIVAGLMQLVHQGRMNAVFEVFDQIDGKVADKVKLLGADVYMTRYDKVAPAGAVKNAEGIYQIEANNTTDTWATRLASGKERR